MTTAELRKEIQGYIAKMPEHKLAVLKPLLSEFAKPSYIIEPASARERKIAEKHFKEYEDNPASFVPLDLETNLTAEEKAVIKAGRKERKEHPENFTPWATVKAEKNSRKGKA